MATDRKTVDYIVDQMAKAGGVAARPMFGEYGVYCDGKMVAIIGDGQLFIKPPQPAEPWPRARRRSHPIPAPSPIC